MKKSILLVSDILKTEYFIDIPVSVKSHKCDFLVPRCSNLEFCLFNNTCQNDKAPSLSLSQKIKFQIQTVLILHKISPQQLLTKHVTGVIHIWHITVCLADIKKKFWLREKSTNILANFTGFYTNWDSFCSKRYKINQVKILVHRALLICSNEFE